jgi:hypothetical protein
MKKLLLIFVLCIGFSAFSQGDRKAMRERIKSEKIAFITDQLELTETEAKGFWPIYNKFESTIHDYKRVDLRSIKQKMRENPNLSDSEADKLLTQVMSIESKMHEARLGFIYDLKKVISPKKIIKLKGVEDEFNRKILDRLREFRKKKDRED